VTSSFKADKNEISVGRIIEGMNKTTHLYTARTIERQTISKLPKTFTTKESILKQVKKKRHTG
jgi:hypothetical protein